MAGSTEGQKLEFQTEAKQLLHLMIHSLYSHKEIFLRELISNASDALDKLRFESLTNPSILDSSTELAIKVKADKDAKTITISDNGIGMSRQEVIKNIGTIARSGSKAFIEKMTGDQKADSNLIGQFGVGFYSVFMVASSVKLTTKRAGSDEAAVVWESNGESQYSLSETQKEDHGTEIVIYLKDEESEYAQDWQVRSIIKKYSDFIAFPIYLPNEKGKEEVVNQSKPLWLRPASEITSEQYEDFFTSSLGGFGKPLTILHNRVEGILEYTSLLFIPSKSPFDLFSMERKHGVKLYVKRVFIMDNCKELLPEYLRFVRGVVDSEDLPLNVSREILQKNPVIERISKALVNKILTKLKELSETEPETYRTFWQEFGPVFKEGIHSDFENKEQLLELVRFQSSMGASKDDLVSLKQYVGRMPQDQKHIYYITGDSREIVEKSPHLEVFRDKSIEVLYLVDPIDEWIVNDIYNFEGKELKSITQGDLDLGDLGKEEKETQEKTKSEYKKLSERIKNILSDSVKEVRVTTRLKDSPACLVADDNAMGSHMERLMKAMGQEVTEQKRILEINAEHPILQNMNSRYEKDPKDAHLEQWAHLLFEGALIAEGQMVPDPLAYSKRVNELLIKVSSS
ncbi:molecular chaperone HtpG [Chitinispirillales bacterium ANBcel5]|uniref:molecular chaperone HtpG n=1 Tax=Cellulosispirillum alkaliphilum TaxID=3039283 RepID=UPI002A577FAF|nr:molecular chaperone HtpG [Chitinispirillales bacterium ANBcel5]